MNKLYILGGGTSYHIRNHLDISVPAYGKTARQLYILCKDRFPDMDVHKMLTKMADYSSNIVTNEDVKLQVEGLKGDPLTKIIFFNVAMCDWTAQVCVSVDKGEKAVASGKHAERLKTSEGHKVLMLEPAEKVINTIRDDREDIFVVGFKTTCGATEEQQYEAGYDLLKTGNIDLVLANDTRTRNNIVIRDSGYQITKNRDEALVKLVETTRSLVA